MPTPPTPRPDPRSGNPGALSSRPVRRPFPAVSAFWGLSLLAGAALAQPEAVPAPPRGAAWSTADATAAAATDPPGRVGRIAELQGTVQWFDGEEGRWREAERNRPLTAGDRLATAADARAELRVGSTVLRLDGGSELEVLRLDDDRMVFQLHAGRLALRVRSRELAEEITLVTAEARLVPLRAGHYRLDRVDDNTRAGVWRGELRVLGDGAPVLTEGERVELWREGRGDEAARTLRHARLRPLDDTFAAWVLREDALETPQSVAQRHVSPELTGAEALDRHGRWERHPEFGVVWLPLAVQPGWAPYRHGRWAWVRPWGWTWIDAAPWGFATSHYGRWLHWGGRWAWVPGPYTPRPAYAPALVAWVGGGNGSVSWSVQVGVPLVGWVPLAPGDVFWPWFPSTPVYVGRVNPSPPPGWRPVRPGYPGHPVRPQPPRPGAVVVYANQHVPDALTWVPRDALHRRDPVDRVRVAPPPHAGRTVRPLPVAELPVRAWRGGPEGAGGPGVAPQPGLPAHSRPHPSVLPAQPAHAPEHERMDPTPHWQRGERNDPVGRPERSERSEGFELIERDARRARPDQRRDRSDPVDRSEPTEGPQRDLPRPQMPSRAMPRAPIIAPAVGVPAAPPRAPGFGGMPVVAPQAGPGVLRTAPVMPAAAADATSPLPRLAGPEPHRALRAPDRRGTEGTQEHPQ